MSDTQRQAPSVLILAADPALGEVLRDGLGAAGFEPLLVRDADEAGRRARGCGPDAYVVDVALPDGAGYAFIADLRAGGAEEPVLLLSATHAPEDLLPVQRGWPGFQPILADGLQDAPRILAALLRHERPNAARRLRYGPMVLDRVERRVCVDGGEVRLTPVEWSLVERLTLDAEHVVARADLIAAIWGPDPDLSSNALDVHMTHVRRKLARAGHDDLIETIRGRGYMLRRPGAGSQAA